MDIELHIDEKIDKEKIVVYAKYHSQEITDIINKLSKENINQIIGYIGTEVFILDIENIWTFYTEGNKVYAKIGKAIYRVKYKLYELENIIDNEIFIKISHSEIINIKYIESLNLGMAGTIIFKFKDGSTTYASRRSIKKIKENLNL